MGLLDAIYSGSDRIKKNVKGLLSDPVKYLEEAANIWGDNWKQLASSPMENLGPGSIGKLMSPAMTVWHGSPHKFDKFDMSKIGTGEGAQAYGHGLYVAESPKVAMDYQKRLSDASDSMTYSWKGGTFEGGKKGDPVAHALGLTYHQGKKTAMDIAKQGLADAKAGEPYALELGGVDYYQRMLNTAQQLSKKDIKATQGQLYKVDIPDEAVARFLDWDKPLSQQQHVLDAIAADEGSRMFNALGGYQGRIPMRDGNGQLTGQGLINRLRNAQISNQSTATAGADQAAAYLSKLGIPGIRYLDGGSRSAGQGSSNFVLFDDQLPRILETNGVPTGLKPWSPGEWQGLLSP